MMLESAWSSVRAPARVMVAVVALVVAPDAVASRPQVFALESYADFAQGDFDGTSLDPDGHVVLGPEVAVWTKDLAGPVLALTETADGQVYVATAAPARIYRVARDKPPELVVELEKPLVTALLAVGPTTLVALTAPDGGAAFVSLKGKSGSVTKTVEAKGVGQLLGGIVDGDTIYAVGGGEVGVLLSLGPGAAAFTTLATVKEESLRSIAKAPVAGKRGLVVGGGAEGIVYLFDGTKLRALVDAAPSEVTGLAVDAKGRVFAALVDAQGKLTDGATARDGDDEKSASARPSKAKEKKPRKVKSSEVLRLDPDGTVHVLWQSKNHGAYSVALDRRGLLVGTGAQGRLLVVDPEGVSTAGVLARAPGFDELVTLVPTRGGRVLIGTAHGGGVLALETSDRRTGTYTSGTLDAKAVARVGHLAWSSRGDGRVTLAMRVGNTAEPDDTWSAFSPVLAAPGVPILPAGRYAQVRATLERGGGANGLGLGFVRWAYLVTNRPPEVVEIEVVAPGFEVRMNERDAPDSRSITFGKQAFKKTPETRGSSAPTLEERPSGKQSESPGYRTVYAFVEDPDDDALRYQFTLTRADAPAKSGVVVKEWSKEPFVSLEMARYPDGPYRVTVDVDDAPTNGAARARADRATSPVFYVAHRRPEFVNAKARGLSSGVRVSFDVDAAVPLSLVTCSVGGGEWLPVDPTDGVLDTPRERFDASVPGTLTLAAASCTATDEAGNTARVDLPLVR